MSLFYVSKYLAMQVYLLDPIMSGVFLIFVRCG